MNPWRHFLRTSFWGWLLLAVVAASVAVAGPPPPHLLHGVVQAVDAEKQMLVVEPGKKGSPTELAVVDGRTKLRQDGKPATLAELAPGQKVRLYYVIELGKFVALEVSWERGDVAGERKEKDE